MNAEDDDEHEDETDVSLVAESVIPVPWSLFIAFRTMRAGDPLDCTFSDHLRTSRLWSRGTLGAEYRPVLHRVDDVCLAVEVCFFRKA